MDSIWSDDLITALAALWAEGHSTAEIGRRLGVSKNAVVGKAHRLSLTPRPSPVKIVPGQQRKRKALPRLVEVYTPSCSWPEGHPGEKSFRFCGERPLAGKPYCAEHAAMAYVRPKNHGSNAA
jgi:GcrA cell cycle regulator